MKTSVIGFPRIGTLRELKFASEKYFRGEISSQELLDTAKNLRKKRYHSLFTHQHILKRCIIILIYI